MPSRIELANAIRALSMDAVEQANSGHPGMPMGMADIAEVLWNDFLRHNPANPQWPDRDRFVLSNGHGSMLLYSLLHLSGYDLSLEQLKNFRQLHSQTPGHPEFGMTAGVETTTGPLGQGLANAVGMALAERHLAHKYNRPGHHIVDHHTYTFVGDGCLMEGISHEVCSLAGTLGLGKLIVFYDDNGISIDGNVATWFGDNTPERFAAYGWHVIADVNGHDAKSINEAIKAAKANTTQPTIICCKTTIGYGAPNAANTAGVHGAALGAEEIAAARKKLGWQHAPFVIPSDIYASWDAREKGQAFEKSWQTQFASYQDAHPELAAEFMRTMRGDLPEQWTAHVQAFIEESQKTQTKMATRKASQACLNAYAPMLPELIGGSADLTGSNCTKWSDATTLERDNLGGNYIHFGVREFGMTAICNGIALHGGAIPFSGTFLTFSDYARNAVRMAALMKLRNIMVYTHDSIGLGEDGPTHQPVEHVAMLRLTPNMSVWRPCDLVETAVAWRAAIERQDGPTCLLLSRQGLPGIERDTQTLANVARGAYILRDSDSAPEAIIIATGSEVELALSAADTLEQQGKQIRVVSMPSCDIFDKQDARYQEAVLPKQVTARIAIEAGSKDYWYKYVGLAGQVIGLTSFGESAPAKEVYNALGITAGNIVDTVNNLL